MKNNSYRDGKVHVKKALCKTCIFRPGNKMHLEEGRVEGMVKSATEDGGAIICHDTLGTKENAVCRGFFNKHKTSTLQVAERLGFIKEV